MTRDVLVLELKDLCSGLWLLASGIECHDVFGLHARLIRAMDDEDMEEMIHISAVLAVYLTEKAPKWVHERWGKAARSYHENFCMECADK
mgnify:CR=1 FL=1